MCAVAPEVTAPRDALIVLTHEVAHLVARDDSEPGGHGRGFARVAARLGLEGPAFNAAGPQLSQVLQAIEAALPPLPLASTEKKMKRFAEYAAAAVLPGGSADWVHLGARYMEDQLAAGADSAECVGEIAAAVFDPIRLTLPIAGTDRRIAAVQHIDVAATDALLAVIGAAEALGVSKGRAQARRLR